MLFALHVPDHTLTAEVSLLSAVGVLIAAAVVLRRGERTVRRPSFALFAIVATLVFVVQMVNFPLLGGQTSGHVLGAAAAVMLLGPLFGGVAMAIVLVLQALMLGDGGTTALGANLLNMAVIAPAAAAIVAGLVRRRRSDGFGLLVAAALAGWFSTVAAALACAAELAISGVGSFGEIAATLVGHHALLGLVEGAVTAALVLPSAWPVAIGRRIQVGALAVVASIALSCVPLSSELPDTLEAVLVAKSGE